MSFRIVNLPSFKTELDAMDWASDRGLEEVRIWRGPDGLIRGSGRQRVDAADVGAVPERAVV